MNDELAVKKLRDLRSGAIRGLLNIELAAKALRDSLEGDSNLDAGEVQERAYDLGNYAAELITRLDQATLLEQLGVQR